MLLIPFFWDKSKEWMRLGVFLCTGGREFWSVDDGDTDADIKEMLKDNGFPVISLNHKDGAVFAEIDPSIDLKNFYLWSEVDPKTSENDLWRIYNIPRALWPCKVFRDSFWKTSGILPVSSNLTIE